MSGATNNTDMLLGQLLEQTKGLNERMGNVEKQLASVVAMTNRWKGATTILIVLGGVVGWASNIVLKALGKA